MDKNALKSIFDRICARLRGEGAGDVDLAYVDCGEPAPGDFSVKPIFATFVDRDLTGYFKLAFAPELFEARPTRSNPSGDPLSAEAEAYQAVKGHYLRWRKQRLAESPWGGQGDLARAYAREDVRAAAGLAAIEGAFDSAEAKLGRLSARAAVDCRAAAKPEAAADAVGLGSAQARASAPWGDPLEGPRGRADDTVACADMPEPRPGCYPAARPEVYYRDRYPSIPVSSIIDGALELLNEKKNLHITEISFCQSHPDFRLAISSDDPDRPGFRKTLEVSINHAAFDRAHKTGLDRYARLKAKLDTNTYIKLRIAYFLYQALKLSDGDARKVSLDIFKIIGSDTRPAYRF